MTEAKKSALQKPIDVAVDDGYAMTKVVLADFTELKFPSLVRTESAMLNGPSDDIPEYRTNAGSEDGTFCVTAPYDAEAQPTEFDGYPWSPNNRVMVNHALIKSGLSGHSVKVATSLPVHNYYAENGKNTPAIDRKNDSILQQVVALGSEPCAKIEKAICLAEGVSAWIDFSFGSDGAQNVTLEGPAAVVDIGGRTTDIVKVLATLSVDRKSSGTKNLGVLDLHGAIRTLIVRHPEVIKVFGELPESRVSRKIVEDVIRTGTYKRHNLSLDMRAQVDAERRRIAKGIMDEVSRKLQKGFDLEHLLFVGGGSIVFRDEIQKFFPTASFVERPEFSNARGMMKYMKFIYR